MAVWKCAFAVSTACLALSVSLSCSTRGPGTGGEKAGEAPKAEALDPANKEKDIRRLLNLSGGGQMGIQVMEQMFETFKKGMPGVPAEFWDEVMAEASPDDLVDLVVPIYHKHLTHEDIRGLIAFYQSPPGRKFVSVQPVIIKESYVVGEEWGRKLAERVMAKLRAKGYR